MNKYIFAALFDVQVLYETELNAFFRIRAVLKVEFTQDVH